MNRKAFFSLTLLLASINVASAGAVVNGIWSPSNCGVEPILPGIDQTSVETFNKSIDEVNAWRDKAEAYNTCLINEANTDTRLIAKTANALQDYLQRMVEKINTETEEAKEKFDKEKK